MVLCALLQGCREMLLQVSGGAVELASPSTSEVGIYLAVDSKGLSALVCEPGLNPG